MNYSFLSTPLTTGIERFPRGIGFSAVRLALRCSSQPAKRCLLGVAFLILFCAAADSPLQAASLYWYFRQRRLCYVVHRFWLRLVHLFVRNGRCQLC